MFYHALSSTKMRSKSSQIHITETILVLAIFLILAIIVFGAYSKFILGSAGNEEKRAFDLWALKSAKLLPLLPELQCSRNNILEPNCIDYFKLKALSISMNDSQQHPRYFGMFGFGSVTIGQVYPSNEEIVLYNNSLAGYSYKNAITLPVSIFYPIKEEYGFGIITIETLSK